MPDTSWYPDVAEKKMSGMKNLTKRDRALCAKGLKLVIDEILKKHDQGIPLLLEDYEIAYKAKELLVTFEKEISGA